MSLLDSVVNKSVNSALASSPALAKTTSTTFAEAGTSISQISENATSTVKNALNTAGISDNTINAPIMAMRDQATQMDPNNATTYQSYAAGIMRDMGPKVSEALPGVKNSIVDIQNAGSNALNSGVSSFKSMVGGVNSSISDAVSKVGDAALPNAQNLLSQAAPSSFNIASASIAKSSNDMFKKVADKAVTENTAKSASTPEVKELPPATTPATNAFTVSHTQIGGTTVSEDLSSKVGADRNSTDVIYQNVKVYIEGVQVPFEACSISQAIGQLPTANFQVPPQAGMMDILRYYQPKVHIFYTDANTGGDRVLFNGHIVACNYSHSKQSSMISISFECLHKNALMRHLTFEWSAGGSSHAMNNSDLLNNNPEQAVVQVNNFNSEASIIMALQGLTGVQSDPKDLIDPSNAEMSMDSILKLDTRFKDFETRLIGMPSAMMNLWNQVKKSIFTNPELNVIFTKVYLPLIEEGLQFFSRVSGHYYLEKQINDTKQEHCNDTARPELSKKVMLPPNFRMNIMSAVQTQMVVNNLNSLLGFSGELMNFHDLFMNFYYGVEYEFLTLASPAEVPCDATKFVDPDDSKLLMAQNRMAVETIVKPQIPFYYAPICNVILPNMYNALSVTHMESEVPTRVTATSIAGGQAVNGASAIGLNYRAPQSIRESVALGKSLLDDGSTSAAPTTLRQTTGSSFNLPGKYELGRGIIQKKIAMPLWLSHVAADNNDNRAKKDDEQSVVQGSIDAKNLANLKAAWEDRYGSDAAHANLNPYSDTADIRAYERLLFSAADYEFTKDVVKSKSGGIDCIFNPYIIPGYPMDILNQNPNHPSFHAMCASVTHSISSRSIGTSVSFMAAVTYTELYNYYMQPVHPWLQTALKLVNVARNTTTANANAKLDTSLLNDTDAPGSALLLSETDLAPKTVSAGPDAPYDSNTGDVVDVVQGLIGNTRAKLVADEFYKSVLGVGAADPGQMYDFSTGEILAVSRSNGIWVDPEFTSSVHTKNGGDKNDNLTGVGGLRLVSRQIEGKAGIEDRFEVKFIDMTPSNYTGTPAKYVNPSLDSSNKALEPGASMFLDYEEIPDFIQDIAKATKKTG